MLRNILLASAVITATALAPSAHAADIFIGARAGSMQFDRKLSPGDGEKYVDQGGDAIRFDIFGGVDFALSNGFFLGGELGLGATSGRSRLRTTTVDYSFSIPYVVETAARAGWRTRDGSALMIRAGALTGLVDENSSRSWNTGLMVGLTTEVVLGHGFAFRIDGVRAELAQNELWWVLAGISYRW